MLFALAAGCRTAPTGTQKALRTVTDDLGRHVSVPVRIDRIVSLAPSVTENVFAVGAGDRLVGVTTFCNYPEQAQAIAKVGDTMNPNMETIVALKPDVVLVSTASQIEAFTKTLEANGIALFVTDPVGLPGVYKSLGDLGDIFGTTEQANRAIAQLKARESSLPVRCTTGDGLSDDSRPLPPIRVFVQISREPLFTIGKQSFLNGVLNEACGRSVTDAVETAFPKLSKETAAALNPEVIILSDSEDNREPNDSFRSSPAVKNGRVYRINADIISRPGPRLVDALEQIAKDLHPESFKDK